MTTPVTYTTIAGDMVDEICYTYYGYTDGATELVLAANPGLAALGPILAQGVVITLPVIAAPTPGNRLWD